MPTLPAAVDEGISSTEEHTRFRDLRGAGAQHQLGQADARNSALGEAAPCDADTRSPKT